MFVVDSCLYFFVAFCIFNITLKVTIFINNKTQALIIPIIKFKKIDKATPNKTSKINKI